MIYFCCDYHEGAHEKIMERLMETNRVQTAGYGCDKYCERAKELILEKCRTKTAAVHFLVGGTQTNATVIAAVLRTHQGVMAAQTAHINVHETGAIESGGHKVLVIPSENGKLTAKQVEEYYLAHMADGNREHTVQPKMVYLSQPTELGTLYSLAELEAISDVCRKNHLFLYVDGARLGYGLAASDNDVTLADMARLCDVFYIGGTKVGALFGEAVVIPNVALQEDFRYVIKQQGAMLAKGRLLGIQFMTLFEDDLYREISEYADGLAEQIRSVLCEKGIPFLVENHTNQIFPVLPDSVLDELRKKYGYDYWQRMDETHSAVRFCTSWATEKEAVACLCADLRELLG